VSSSYTEDRLIAEICAVDDAEFYAENDQSCMDGKSENMQKEFRENHGG
jgi:hypothetical protein